MADDIFGFIEMFASVLTLGVAAYGFGAWRAAFVAERAQEHLRLVCASGRAVTRSTDSLCESSLSRIGVIQSFADLAEGKWAVGDPQFGVAYLDAHNRASQIPVADAIEAIEALRDAIDDAAVDLGDWYAEHAQRIVGDALESVRRFATLGHRLQSQMANPFCFGEEEGGPRAEAAKLASMIQGHTSLRLTSRKGVDEVIRLTRRAYQSVRDGPDG